LNKSTLQQSKVANPQQAVCI